MKLDVIKPNIPLCYKDCEAPLDEPLEAQRKEIQAKEENWLYLVRLGFLWLAVFVTTVVVLIYLWHICSPASWRWLCSGDVVKIKDLSITIIVGIVLSMSTTYFFKK